MNALLVHPEASGVAYRPARSFAGRVGFAFAVLILCLLPVENLLLPFELRPVDLVVVGLIALGLVWGFQRDQRLHFPLLGPMWLILVGSLTATLTGLAHPNSVYAMIQDTYLFIWFIVLANVLAAQPRSDFERLLRVWSLVALVEATTTLLGMLRLGPDVFYTSPVDGRVLAVGALARGIGTFGGPNAAGGYLSISFFVLLATGWPGWVRAVCGSWLLAGVFATGSYGAMVSTSLALTALCVAAVVLSRPERAALLFRGGAVLLGIGLALGVLVLAWPWFGALLRDVDVSRNPVLGLAAGRVSRSFLSRLDLVGSAWEVYHRYPLGTGPNTFVLTGGSLHNDYIAFALERGPVGFAGWLWLVGAALYAALRTASGQADPRLRWLVLALGAGFLACALNAIGHEVSHFRQMWVLLAFLFGAIYVLTSPRGESAPGRPREAEQPGGRQ